MENVVVYILGFPGVGKYTIAREICAKVDNFRLVDNHLINNPIFSVVHCDGHTPLPDSVWENTGKIRRVVLDTLINISPREYSFVLTNCLWEDDLGDREIYDEVENMALAREAVFVPVRLSCSLEEIERRVVSEEREVRFKTTNVGSIRRSLEKGRILNPGHKNFLDFDVADISATEAAERILAHVRRVMVGS